LKQEELSLNNKHLLEQGTKELKGGVVDTKTRTSHISWIPFKKMTDMYKDIERIMKTTNGNHFWF
jgi:hypothetical protein